MNGNARTRKQIQKDIDYWKFLRQESLEDIDFYNRQLADLEEELKSCIPDDEENPLNEW